MRSGDTRAAYSLHAGATFVLPSLCVLRRKIEETVMESTGVLVMEVYVRVRSWLDYMSMAIDAHRPMRVRGSGTGLTIRFARHRAMIFLKWFPAQHWTIHIGKTHSVRFLLRGSLPVAPERS